VIEEIHPDPNAFFGMRENDEAIPQVDTSGTPL